MKIIVFNGIFLLFTQISCMDKRITNPGAKNDELFAAVELKDNKSIEQWLTEKKYSANERGKYNDHIFLHAVGIGDVACMELLIQHGAQVKLTAKWNHNSTLHIALDYFYQDPQLTLKKVELLLKNNVNVHALDFLNRTPLHRCAQLEHEVIVPIMKSLIAHQADVDTPNKIGRTTLHQAMYSDCTKKYNIKKIRLLLKHKASVNALDDQGLSPLHVAIQNGNFPGIQLLAQHDADLFLRTPMPEGKTPLDLARALDGEKYPFKKMIIRLFTLLTIPHTIVDERVVVEEQQ